MSPGTIPVELPLLLPAPFSRPNIDICLGLKFPFIHFKIPLPFHVALGFCGLPGFSAAAVSFPLPPALGLLGAELGAAPPILFILALM